MSRKLFFRISFCVIFTLIFSFFILNILKPLFYSDTVIIKYGLYPFNICEKHPEAWFYMKKIYFYSLFISLFFISNYIFSVFFKNLKFNKKEKNKISLNSENLNLFIGKNYQTSEDIFLEEKGLFQNFLITGTIGSGKTSGVIYPFAKQLISYSNSDISKKLGLLILDVKGNLYKEICKYCAEYDRNKDLYIIEVGGNVKYNPLDKPHLKPSVLADRLVSILSLFSSNNSDSYWLDKASQVLTEAIKLCRLYNNNYVTFIEIHKLITDTNYYYEKIKYLKELFKNNKLNNQDIYNLSTCIDFFEKEFFSTDSRVVSIIKSEITRITSTFVNDLQVLNTFCPNKNKINFKGFSQLINEGKIVVLNMNISEYRNLSKIIAAYLKLDFQSEVLMSINKSTNNRITAFICDEYQEYVLATDANFYAQSREAKCINIVATQSYTSLINSIKDVNSVKVIIQNLINKLWFRTDDIFTIEDAQKQLGKEIKLRTSTSISENAKETKFSFIINSFKSNNSNISESLSSFEQNDFIYDLNYFTQELETFSCMSFLSNGTNILKPCKLKVIPNFMS